MALDISVIILTHNEEDNIQECLKSVSWCDDIVVLDSGSQDDTVAIAKRAGARVLHRTFDNFGEQRNYALTNGGLKHQWVFHLDADERFTEALRDVCEQAIKEDKWSGFYVPSKLMLGERWLKRSGGYPVYQMRFHKVNEVHFVSHGHGQRESASLCGIAFLHEPYIHYNFSKGLAEWCRKHVEYAKREAEEQPLNYACRDLFSANAIIRRRNWKALFMRLPGRSFLKFIHLYFVKLGFIEGKAGFVYCMLHTFYEFMIVIFQWEKRGQNSDDQRMGSKALDRKKK